MRILHLSALPVWPMAGKGGMPSLFETLRGHVRGGHEVVLILPQYHLFNDDLIPLAVREDAGYEVHVAPCAWMPGVKGLRAVARRLGADGKLPYGLRWLLNGLTCLLLTGSLVLAALRVRYRNRRQVDLVYAHNEYAALAGWLIGALFGVANVTRLYGTFLADLMKRPLVWLRYPVAAAGYLVPHDLLICGNDGTRGDEVAERLGIDPTKFRFWQNGVDPPGDPPCVPREVFVDRSSGRLRRDSLWAVSCSRLSYWKRIDRMLRALRICRDAGGDCQLLVAGDGEQRERLASLAEEVGVGEEVVWLGAVAHRDIWALMHVADVFMITNDVTNRCNPLYEAICAGLPVVSIRDPSTADLLEHGDNALLADPDDDDQLGRHLYELEANPGLAKRLGDAQRRRAQGLWTWEERMATEVSELERLVARN